jgi:major membrane immunogen (membrane-anchored lipoprotein)
MKKILIVLIITIIAFLTGCSEEEQQLKGLVSDKEGIYGLYVVGDEKVDGSKLASEGIDESKIHVIYHPKSLEVAQDSFSTAEIGKAPAYVVLDDEGIVLKTYDYDELVGFLKSRIASK